MWQLIVLKILLPACPLWSRHCSHTRSSYLQGAAVPDKAGQEPLHSASPSAPRSKRLTRCSEGPSGLSKPILFLVLFECWIFYYLQELLHFELLELLRQNQNQASPLLPPHRYLPGINVGWSPNLNSVLGEIPTRPGGFTPALHCNTKGSVNPSAVVGPRPRTLGQLACSPVQQAPASALLCPQAAALKFWQWSLTSLGLTSTPNTTGTHHSVYTMSSTPWPN